MAIMLLLASIAIPLYSGYRDTAEMNKIVREMQGIELMVEDFKLSLGDYPDTLADVGVDMNDPWGQPYQYLPIEGRGQQAQNNARKDHNLHPINSDFDLYSIGEDGRSVKPLTGGPSKDDIIRANNGAYYGYGKDY